MIIPRVQKEIKSNGFISFSEPIKIFQADYPAEKAFSVFKLFCPTVVFRNVKNRVEADIILECLPSVSKNEEFYTIHAAEYPVVVNYRSFSGARNAVASLAQLLTKTDAGYKIDKTEIEDWPDFEFRSVMLDPARGIIPMQIFKDAILRMALAKCNFLHLHLSDGGGYVIKSDICPQVSGPDGKQYTKAEIKEIIAYADMLGIEIMPEVEFPAHAFQLLKDMPQLMCVTKNEIPSPWAVCAGNEETYEVLENLYTELAELFPGRYIHVGTDEIEMNDLLKEQTWPTWHDCVRCNALCAEEGFENNRTEIFYYMLRRVYKMISKLGKRLVMWNDNIDIAKTPELPRDILIHFWRVASENRGPNIGCSMQRFLEEGFEIINSWYPETYIEANFYKNNDSTILVWDPSSNPECDAALSGQILGGEPCAWGGQVEYEHFAWTLPTSIMLFSDRLWNKSVCGNLDEYGKAGTRHQLGINAPADLNIFGAFGGFMQPRYMDRRMWEDKAADDDCLAEIDKILETLDRDFIPEGRLAGEYRKSIAWLKEKRKG
ncbi:MAG: family 20 glycosylhydrolase [Oscillospiraceae bacterium]|nr:family 20 glycosylhydrolase [Oscillospiraceae bacterium]